MRLPWRRAPLAVLGSPVTVLVGVVTGLVVAFVVASTVFHVSAAGSAAVQYVIGKRCPDESGISIERGGRGIFARSQADGLSARMLMFTASAQRNGLDVVRRTRFASELPMTVGGQNIAGRLVSRDGAQQHVTPTAGGGTDGVWLPSELADLAGAGVGDEVVMATDAGPVTLPVTAVYPTITDPVGDFWCSQRSEVVKLLAVPENTIRPPLLLVSPELMARLVDDGMPVHIDRVQLTTSTLPTDRDGAERLATAVAAVRADLDAMDLGRIDYTQGQAAVPTTVGDRAGYPAQSAARAQQAVGGSLLPLTLTSLAVGLAAVAGLAGLWAQRRSAELRLLWTRGVSPAALGGKAALELGLPLLVGAALGWAAARASVPLLAPAPQLDGWAVPYAAAGAAAAWLASVLMLAVTATLRTRRLFQPVARAGTDRVRRAARWAPWELPVAAVGVLSWRRLSDGALVVSPDELLPRVDVLALMFPLLCLAVLVGVGTRLAGLALRLGHRLRGWRWPSLLWALRRSAAQHRLTVALLAVAGLAVGVVAVGVGISQTERAAVLDKGRLFVGSDTAVRLVASEPTSLDVPPALRGSATQVGVRDDEVFGQTVRTMVLDPRTVADGMPWRPEWAGGAELSELVSRLGPAGADGVVPVLAFGTARPEGPPTRVVGTMDTFPGREHAKSMIVMSWDALPDGDTNGFTRYVLSSGDATTVVRELETAGEPTGWVYTAARANDALPFLVVAWTFDFFVTLGAVLAAVALAALLVTIEARRRATAVAHALLARMGLRVRATYLSQLAELAALALAATALGLLGGWLVLATASTRLDPAPFLSPAPVPVSLLPLGTLVLAVAAVAVALTAAVATRAVLRAPVRELLRGVA